MPHRSDTNLREGLGLPNAPVAEQPPRRGPWLRRTVKGTGVVAAAALAFVLWSHHSRVDVCGTGKELGDGCVEAFLAAVGKDDVRLVERFLERNSRLRDARDAWGAPALVLATGAGSWSVAEVLLARGAAVDVWDDQGSTPLHHAVRDRRPETCARIVAEGAGIGRPDSGGQTALDLAAVTGAISVEAAIHDAWKAEHPAGSGATQLHEATSRDATALVLLLLGEGAEVDATDRDGRTALHRAAMNADVETMRVLIDAQASVDVIGNDGLSPLWLTLAACRGGLAWHFSCPEDPPAHERLAAASLLLDHGAEPEPRDEVGWPLLMRVLEQADLEAAVLLLERGARAETTNALRATPLHVAADTGDRQAAEVLLASGADLSPLGASGETPLHVAAGHGWIGVVSLLLERGAPASLPDAQGRTPLHRAAEGEWASKKDHAGFSTVDGSVVVPLGDDPADETKGRVTARNGPAVVRGLLAAGADADARDLDGRTPLHVAAERGAVRAIEILLDGGAEADARNRVEATPLLVALAQENEDAAAALVAGGAALESAGRGGITPLSMACFTGQEDTARILLEAGADPDRWGGDWACLHAAASQGHPDIVSLALEFGADPEGADRKGNPPLFHAIHGLDVDCIRALLDAGADAGALGSAGTPALVLAASEGIHEILSLLIEHGASLDARDRRGRSPLHTAVGAGHRHIVSTLLAAGAAVDIRDRRGLTPLDHAVSANQERIAEMLRRVAEEDDPPPDDPAPEAP